MEVKQRRLGAELDKRISMRFDKAFTVVVGSEVFGDCRGVARNISDGGMFVELLDPPPLGSVITVHFKMPGGSEDIVARAEVKHHYCLNFARDGRSAPRARHRRPLRGVHRRRRAPPADLVFAHAHDSLARRRRARCARRQAPDQDRDTAPRGARGGSTPVPPVFQLFQG